ncbi:MAG: CPBP family intramembrane metalloprotease, partial [Lentilactobacillus parabuchneri]|nr:CPBP family intramembrane metalloprotease [Lentilactobacillus parabuchneri]
MVKNRLSWAKKFLLAALFIILLMGVDFSVQGASPLLRGIARIIYAVVVAGIVYYVLGTTKIFTNKIQLNTFAK